MKSGIKLSSYKTKHYDYHMFEHILVAKQVEK